MKYHVLTDIPDIIHDLAHLAERNGYSIYVVGGYVRDRILGIDSKDIDFTVVGDAIAFAHLVAESKHSKAVIYERFRTALVPVGEYLLEFVGTRKEEYEERVDKILETLKTILLNKDMVSFVDKTNPEWKVMLSDAKKSPKQTRYWNQNVTKEFLSAILNDTNKGL